MQPTGILENSKATNPLQALLSFGQSMWLDYIRRDLITSGSLKKIACGGQDAPSDPSPEIRETP